jgi:aspartate kinase
MHWNVPERLLVEKVGGTSMSRFDVVVDNVIKRSGLESYSRAIVVSAFGGITDLLLENKRDATPGVYQHLLHGTDWQTALQNVRTIMCEHHRKFSAMGLPIDQAQADSFVEDRVDLVIDFLSHVKAVLAYGYVESHPLMLASREMLAGIGEAHSAYVATHILNNLAIPATLVDLTGWNNEAALTLEERIVTSLSKVDFTSTLAIVTGYCKGTEGIMRHFDRGYSEVTFSRIAVLGRAVEAIIHKEFHLSSADPRLVGKDSVVPIGLTNFDVADQLADIGMEAIHPQAAKPLEKAGISVRVCNVFDVDHGGTLISISGRSPEPRVEMVTGCRHLVMLEIHDTAMVGGVGIDLTIMKAIVQVRMSYIFKSTNANTITIAFHERDWKPKVCELLSVHFEKILVSSASLLSIVGSNLEDASFFGRAATALAANNIRILAAGQASRATSMQFVVDSAQFDTAIIALHDELVTRRVR